MLPLLLVCVVALREQVTVSLLDVAPSGGSSDGLDIQSACTQSSDWTSPSISSCQRPCRFAEEETYIGYKTTMEGSCQDQRAVLPCPVQPPFCDNAADCVGAWGEWSSCDATCGGGLQSRTRTLNQDCLLSCFECATQWRTCNPQACGYDCVLDDSWGEWSACSATCFSGDASFLATRHRYKRVIQGVSPGVLCTPDQYVQTEVCHVDNCPVDCVLSGWGEWTACNVQCGCGHRSRERKIVTAPSSNGIQCGQLTQVEECSCQPCPRDCQLSEWSFGPCMGDCYQTLGSAKLFPMRRKSRYVIQEQIPFNGGCATPCQLETTQECTWLPPCDDSCSVTEWSEWKGNCTGCVPYGSQIPTQERFRSITSYGSSGFCGCTKEIRVCDLNWCCEDCKVSEWSDWGACVGYTCGAGVSSAQGIQRRERHVLAPANPCGQACPSLVDTRTCRTCCPIDCQVSEWVLEFNCARPTGPGGAMVEVTCGTEPGIRRYRRTFTPGNECGAPCPADGTVEFRDEVCYPKFSCCPVDCAMSEWTTSECFGCGRLSVAWKSREITRTPACGGQTCCDIDCVKFVQVRCPNPTPCPQTPCIYGPFGDWDNCPGSCHATNSPPNRQCRLAPLIEGPADCPRNQTDCVECNGQCCPVNCEVGSWGEWGACSSSCGHGLQSRFRPITTPQSCGGAFCPIVQEFKSCEMPDCPVDCVISEWSYWSLCPSCAIEGGATISERFRTILRQPSGGGAACPADRYETVPCSNLPCDRDCVVSSWGPWGACSVLFGDGFRARSRTIAQTKVGAGMDCPPLRETQWCYIPPPPTCIIGPPVDEPCPVTCHVEGTPIPNFIRHRAGLPLVVASTNATLETCPDMDELVPCSLPCCPVDCIVEPWGPWSDCIDGVKNRTRAIISQPKCGGAACPVCYLEKDDCPYVPPANECERGEACEDGFTTMITDSR